MKKEIENFAKEMDKNLKKFDKPSDGSHSFRDAGNHRLVNTILDLTSKMHENFKRSSVKGVHDNCIDIANLCVIISSKFGKEKVKKVKK